MPPARISGRLEQEASMSVEAWAGLRVVPYVRGRLPFAALAAQAAAEGAFDCLAVDWPGFVQGLLPVVLPRLPLTTALLIENDRRCALLPFLPADAACAAAWRAQRDGRRVECLDFPAPAGFSEEVSLPAEMPSLPEEPERLADLEEYFHPLWENMEAAWRCAPARTRRSITARAARFAGRIRGLLAVGSRVLAVCEYRLWWCVRRQLEDGEQPPEGQWSPEFRAALIFENPLLLWGAGLFDEFPAVMRAFFDSLKADQPGPFRRRAALAALLGQDAGLLPPDAAARRPGDLLDHLRTRLGVGRALECARRLLEYPAPGLAQAGADLPAYLRLQAGGMLGETERFPLPDALHCVPYYPRALSELDRFCPDEEQQRRLDWVGWTRPYITRQEAKALRERGGSVRFAVKQDYRLHREVCTRLRQLIRSRAPSCPALDEFTPVAFLFSPPNGRQNEGVIHDSNPVQRRIELGLPATFGRGNAPDMVYSLYYVVRAGETVHPGLLEREWLDALVLLYTGEEMGPDRYAAITARPKQQQCRVPPGFDPSLMTFRPGERGLAWAVKYAQQAVIVVHYPDWRPSSGLADFAAERGVSLLTLPLDVLPAPTVERLRRLHYMYPALKKHPENERIVGRFLPPLDEEGG
jgi:hypothetical protein